MDTRYHAFCTCIVGFTGIFSCFLGQALKLKVSLIFYDSSLMTHHLDWISIPFIRSPRFGLHRLFGQENVNFHNFMVGFDGWMCGTFIFVAFMCHNGSTSSTTSKLNCVGVRFADTTLKINFSSIWSNQKSKECCKRRKSRRIKIKPDWWLITFAVMWPNPNFNFYTLQHVDFKIKILQNVLLKKP